MNKISGVICNEQAEVECIVKNEHQLFKGNHEVSLFDVVDSDSRIKLTNFLETTRDEKTGLNWEINVKKDDEMPTLFFSGLFWMGKYLIQISSEKSKKFFYPYNPEQYDLVYVKDEDAVPETSSEKLNEISRLNNELIDIQRELTKKNRKLEQLNERLEKLSTIDFLTDIYNRRAILNRARTELARASREGQIFNLAILDLDEFKRINDTYGHQTGDEALRRFAECLREFTRKYDAAGRFGGDEFLVYFSLDEVQKFRDIMDRLLAKIESINIDTDKEESIRLEASIGGIFVNPEAASGINIEDVISQADYLLYKAKNDGERKIIIDGIKK